MITSVIVHVTRNVQMELKSMVGLKVNVDKINVMPTYCVSDCQLNDENASIWQQSSFWIEYGSEFAIVHTCLSDEA